MIGSTTMCEKRIVALLDMYGRDTVLACIQEMMRRTELAVREEIRRIPDGIYTGASATDDDGTTLDEPVWVRARITVKGDEMTIDLSESDAQRKGFVNSVYAATYGNAIAAVILYFDPALADYHNQGTMEPIKIIAPPGSVVNCHVSRNGRRFARQCRCPGHGGRGRGFGEGAAAPRRRRLGQASRRLRLRQGPAHGRALRAHLLRL